MRHVKDGVYSDSTAEEEELLPKMLTAKEEDNSSSAAFDTRFLFVALLTKMSVGTDSRRGFTGLMSLSNLRMINFVKRKQTTPGRERHTHGTRDSHSRHTWSTCMVATCLACVRDYLTITRLCVTSCQIYGTVISQPPPVIQHITGESRSQPVAHRTT